MPREMPARVKQWFSTQQSFVTLAGNAQDDLALYNAVIHGPRFIKGATVERMIIKMLLRSPVTTQDNTLFWGIVVVNSDARAALAFPEADDMSDRPGWLVRDTLENSMSNLSDAAQWSQTKMDIRTGRILRNEEDELSLVVDNGSANALQWAIFIRVLMLLP